MAITQNITNLPTPPQRTDPANFDSRADAFMAALDDLASEINTWAGQTNDVADDVVTYKNAAFGYADDAATSETNAETASQAATSAAETAQGVAQSAVQDIANELVAIANATIYDAGETYSAGDIVFDPADSYRLYTSQQNSNTGNTPSSDEAWWAETLGPTTTAINLNKNTIDYAYTIPDGCNASSVGSISVNAKITLNGVWKIL